MKCRRYKRGFSIDVWRYERRQEGIVKNSSVKGIRVSVAVKGAVKGPRKCRDGAKHRLKRTLRRTLHRVTYLDTLNRPT